MGITPRMRDASPIPLIVHVVNQQHGFFLFFPSTWCWSEKEMSRLGTQAKLGAVNSPSQLAARPMIIVDNYQFSTFC